MDSLPIFVKLQGRSVLVVGDSDAALAKLRMLVRTQARITVLTPRGHERLGEFVGEFDGHSRLDVATRPFVAGDVAGKALVYSASGDDALDRRVAAAARAAGVPVNVVDRTELCDFITPAIVDRDPLTVAISSNGAAPVLARRLRARIEALLPTRLGTLAAIAGGFRDTLKKLLPDVAARRRFWDRFFDLADTTELLALDTTIARSTLIELAHREAAGDAPAGRVLLVGAGPGDPELLTVKAHRALQRADVIVYDKLVSPDVLDYARRDAEFVFVGKSRGDHSVSQDAINALLVDHARAGRMVVRLKSGDPFVFGRAGEEIESLRTAGVAVEVVPGITALAGCAAVAQIPLTHRDHASAVTLITGQLKKGVAQDWTGLAGPGRTLAIYMGLGTAQAIAEKLVVDGFDPATPVAVVENGTRTDERRFYGPLSHLPRLVADHQVASPALIIVGEVAALAKDWPADALAPLQAAAADIEPLKIAV